MLIHEQHEELPNATGYAGYIGTDYMEAIWNTGGACYAGSVDVKGYTPSATSHRFKAGLDLSLSCTTYKEAGKVLPESISVIFIVKY